MTTTDPTDSTDTTDPTDTTDTVGPVLAHLDPRALLVDLNFREATLDRPFVASVERHGVLMPIVAVTTPAGVRVRMGHRRALAAVEAGLATVPVYVTGGEDDDVAARIVGQWVENKHRAALSTMGPSIIRDDSQRVWVGVCLRLRSSAGRTSEWRQP